MNTNLIYDTNTAFDEAMYEDCMRDAPENWHSRWTDHDPIQEPEDFYRSAAIRCL